LTIFDQACIERCDEGLKVDPQNKEITKEREAAQARAAPTRAPLEAHHLRASCIDYFTLFTFIYRVCSGGSRRVHAQAKLKEKQDKLKKEEAAKVPARPAGTRAL